jgi:hypothetical protein
LEGIDVRTIMREYFKNNKILLQHQQEKRARVDGDYTPDLLYEVKEDTVILKWQVITNTTPLAERKAPATKEIKFWNTRQQYPVIALKCNPTKGIDFDKTWEYLK